MDRLRLPRRILLLLGFIILDLMLAQVYLAQNTTAQVSLSQLRSTTINSSPLPTASPEMNLRLSNTDWQGNRLVGKLENTNTYATFASTIKVSISKSQDPWEEIQTLEIMVPSVIKPNTSLFFSAIIPAIKLKEFWWTARLTSTQIHTGQSVEKLPKDMLVSNKRMPIQPQIMNPTDDEPWGKARQIDDVTWTIKVGQDERMATPQETLEALNRYRQIHSAGPLTWDDNLAQFAGERAKYLNTIKSTDKHQGFRDYVASENNIKKLGFWALGENSGYGNRLLGVHLIEWIYASDKGHNQNQLDTQWSHIGIGIDGLAVVFIFGGSKIE